MTKNISVIETRLRLTKVIGTIVFFLLINSLHSQTDTTRKTFSADKKISKDNLAILFQDSLYTVYVDAKTLHRRIKLYGHPTLDKISADMKLSGSKEFYAECNKAKAVRLNQAMTGILIQKNKALLVSNVSKKHEAPISYKRYTVIKKNNAYWPTMEYFVKNHLLFSYSYMEK